MATITVPEEFAVATVAREGEAGRRWLAALPSLVETLCRQWDALVDGASMHGYLALVVPVRRGDEAAVLKISWGDESSRDEAAALAHWAGRGAVRLLAVEPSLGALLLERLDHRRSLNDVAIEDAVTIAGRLLRRLAIDPPPGIRSSQVVAAQLHANLLDRWEASGRPMPRHILDQARDLARHFAAVGEDLLVDYDLHYENVLASRREPWLVVDPKVVVGDPEFGVAQLLWQRLEEMETRGGLERFFRLLTAAAELDPARARAWTLLRCVDYWLWALGAGLTYDPARCERIVAWLVE
jgi:streptomycin 6-kinase